MPNGCTDASHNGSYIEACAFHSPTKGSVNSFSHGLASATSTFGVASPGDPTREFVLESRPLPSADSFNTPVKHAQSLGRSASCNGAGAGAGHLHGHRPASIAVELFPLPVHALGPASPQSPTAYACPCCDGSPDDDHDFRRGGPDIIPSESELWGAIQLEAQREAQSEPDLASFLWSTILSHSTLYDALCFRLANKLANPTLLSTQLNRIISNVFEKDPYVRLAIRCDLAAVKSRDPACKGYSQPLLHFKGFQALQAYRVAHSLWVEGRHALAHALQSLISDVFHVDIHPAARIGKGILIDHAIGVVIGETAVVGDNVSILHNVTLGGNGKETGDRHPKVGHGVLLGAHVTVLGNIRIGAFAKVGAGSVVLTKIPPRRTAVGVPARVVGGEGSREIVPAAAMDHHVGQVNDQGEYVLDFQI